ncbi:importin-13 [Anabrus simplex]|uniref:importin-13 n=1 Tax=Anabrus simplex TaxID=316456 RepID=UPI0035A38E50
MEFTIENLERAVAQFYHTDAAMQARAHQWLTASQTSPEAWTFVWELLHPSKSTELQFFAATTLHTKVVKWWKEVPVDQYPTLKKQLLEAIASHCLGPKIVLNRLCIALSAYVLQTIPVHWPNAINELLATLQPSNLPSVPPERTAWILLEILTVLPEEFQSSHLTQNQKGLVRNELQKNVPQVLALLEGILSSNTCTTVNESSWEVIHQAVRCASSWLQLGVPLPECTQLSEHLVAVAFSSSSSPNRYISGVPESALEALTNMATHPDTHKYPATCLQLMGRLLPLHEIIQRAGDDQCGEAGHKELVSSVYCLFIATAESHSRLLLDALLTEDESKNNVLRLIHVILQCSNSPGAYPVQETCSQLALGFWYILQDDMMASEPEQQVVYTALLSPVYRSLAEVMLNKSMLPADDESWTSEEREQLRCYRQDVADTMMYCYNVLHEGLLELLQCKLEAALSKYSTASGPRSWQPLESCLHAFFAVAECIDVTEEQYMPRFLATLQQMPFQHLDVRVIATALNAVGACAEWINNHPSVLGHVIPLLMMGLGNPDVAPASTMALKDLTRECISAMAPFASHILQASQEALQGGRLKLSECVRLMCTVGRVLSILPMEQIVRFLDLLIMPYVEELQSLAVHENDITLKANVVLRLKMLSMLFATLNTRADSEGEEHPPPASNEPIQPVFLVLQRALPTLASIAARWYDDTNIMQAVCSVLKHSVSTLLEDCKPLLADMLGLLVKSYELQPHPAALDITHQFLILFGRDTELRPTMQTLLQVMCRHVMMRCFCPGTNISEHSDVVEGFFNLMAQVLKKNPQLFANFEGEDMAALFQYGTLTLSIPEVPALKAASSFLVNLISQSRDIPVLLNVVQAGGDVLVHRLLRCVGGDIPRAALDPVSDIFLMLNKKHCDNLGRWMQQAMQEEGFPSQRVSPTQKEHFVKSVLRERANKRKLQDIVREFSLICRGLQGSEYGTQSSPFF